MMVKSTQSSFSWPTSSFILDIIEFIQWYNLIERLSTIKNLEIMFKVIDLSNGCINLCFQIPILMRNLSSEIVLLAIEQLWKYNFIQESLLKKSKSSIIREWDLTKNMSNIYKCAKFTYASTLNSLMQNAFSSNWFRRWMNY